MITVTLSAGLSPQLSEELRSWRRPQGFDDTAVAWSLLAERANPGRVRLHTVQARHGERLAGVAIVHTIRKLAVGDYTGGVLERLTRMGKRLGFTLFGYDIAYLEIPFANRSGLLLAPGLDEATEDRVLAAMLDALNALDCDALCIKTDHRDVAAARALAGRRLVRLPFVDHNLLTFKADTPSPEAWLAQLERRHRYAVRQKQRLFREAGGRIEQVNDPTPYASVLGELSAKTLAKAKADGGLPLPMACGTLFYERFHEMLGDAGTVLLARVQGNIVGFHAYVRTFDTLFAKFIGLDYAVSAESFAYFNLIYRAIELAAESGLRYVDTGSTLCDVKRRFGCTHFPTHYHVDFRHFSLRPLAPLLKRRFSSEGSQA